MGPLWIYQGRPSYLGKSSLTQAQSYVDAGYTPEQTQIVLGSKSMSTVKQYNVQRLVTNILSGWSALEILYWLHEKQAIPRRYDDAKRH